MILTVTPNSAVDWTVFLPHFHWEGPHRADKAVWGMAGKPAGAAWILGELGVDTTAMGFAAGTYGEKMILIDTLLHRYHWELEGDPGGPGAVGLIGGSRTEVIAFLNELTYGGGSTPGLQQTRTQWRKKLGWAGWTEENVDERSREHRWEGFRREDRRVTE